MFNPFYNPYVDQKNGVPRISSYSMDQLHGKLIKASTQGSDNLTATDREQSKVQLIKHYIEIGGDPNAEVDDRKEPLLHYVLRNYKSEDAAQILIQAGANINNVDPGTGNTALHIAADLGLVNILPALISEETLNARKVTTEFIGRGNTPLLTALWSKQISAAQILLNRGANIEITGNRESTPLHMAVRQELSEFFPQLISLKTINARDEDGQTPFLSACFTKKEELIGRILVAKADVTIADKKGLSPLHLAASFRLFGMVRLLLNLRANPNCVDNTGDAPLFYALQYDDKGSSRDSFWRQYILGYGSSQKKSAAEKESERNNIAQLIRILMPEMDIHLCGHKGYTLFHIAFETDFIDIIPYLPKIYFKMHFDTPCSDGSTPLMLASKTEQNRLVRRLLSKKANPNSINQEGNSALILAIEKARAQNVKDLLKAGADLARCNAEGQPPLCLAVRTRSSSFYPNNSDYIEIIRTLLEARAPVNAQNKEGQTALHVAAKYTLPDCIKELLDFNANFLLKDNEGKNPIILSMTSRTMTARRETEVFCTLIKLLPDLKGIDWGGNAPLHLAIDNLHTAFVSRSSESQLKMLQELLNRNVDLNLTNQQGETPLLYALRTEKIEAVHLLMTRNASLFANEISALSSIQDIKSVVNKALSSAVKYELFQFIPLLLAAGADQNASDSNGKSAYEWAVADRRYAIVATFENMPEARNALSEDVIQFLANLAEKTFLEQSSNFHLPKNEILIHNIYNTVIKAMPALLTQYRIPPDQSLMREAFAWELLSSISKKLATRTWDYCSEFAAILLFDFQTGVASQPLHDTACKLILEYYLNPELLRAGRELSMIKNGPYGKEHVGICYQELFIRRIAAINTDLSGEALSIHAIPERDRQLQKEFPNAKADELQVLKSPNISNNPLLRMFTLYLGTRMRREARQRTPAQRKTIEHEIQKMAMESSLKPETQKKDPLAENLRDVLSIPITTANPATKSGPIKRPHEATISQATEETSTGTAETDAENKNEPRTKKLKTKKILRKVFA